MRPDPKDRMSKIIILIYAEIKTDPVMVQMA